MKVFEFFSDPERADMGGEPIFVPEQDSSTSLVSNKPASADEEKENLA